MPRSRAVIVLGMHRSGTSVLARGLRALGVFLGDEFLSSRPDNPTGYWEDRVIVDLNERLLDFFGLSWESISLIADAQWQSAGIQALHREAVDRVRSYFVAHPLWGFKDPRTIRLLPFWRAVLQRLDVDDQYVVAIRNPISVAASLWKRQSMPAATSHLISLAYLAPHLHEIANKPFVVVDYDHLMAEPREQLARVRSALELPCADTGGDEIDHFSTAFLDSSLRHDHASPDDFDTIPYVSPLVREAYLRLYQLATDQVATNSPAFWSAWRRLRTSVESLISSRTATSPQGADRSQQEAAQDAGMAALPVDVAGSALSGARHPTNQAGEHQFSFENRTAFDHTGVRLFVVIGAQCTGTNLLREILNTNSHLAMLGEVLFPNTAPAHWENFLKVQAPGAFPAWEARETEVLLDRYLRYVLYRVRNFWHGGDKSRSCAIGVDIRYHQIQSLNPGSWNSETPFLLSYLKSREAVLIHVTRRSAIDAAVSALIATQTNRWQNYDGVVAAHPVAVDPELCLEYARTTVREGASFLNSAVGCRIVEVCYEDLVNELAAASPAGEVPERPGPLHDVVRALDVPFEFRCDGRIREAINLPCSKMLLNLGEVSAVVRQSEFSPLAYVQS